MTRLVCLNLRNTREYQRYRNEMAPILSRHGGQFLLDVEVSESHISPADFALTRVLLIQFPSDSHQSAFFADPQYQAVRAQWFEPAVAHTLAIGV